MTEDTEIKVAKDSLAKAAEELEGILKGKPWFKVVLAKEGLAVESFGVPEEAIPILCMTLAAAISTGQTSVKKSVPETIN